MCVFIILQHCHGARGWNSSPWKIRTRLHYIAYTLASDDLVSDAKSQRISSHGVDIVLQEYSRSGTEGLTFMVVDDLNKINKTSILIYPGNWGVKTSPKRRHHNYVVHERHGVSNHQQINLFMLTIRKHQTPEILVPCEGNQPVTGEFPSQRTSNAESVSMAWRRYESIAIGLSW